MKTTWIPLLLLLCEPLAARGDTIYATWAYAQGASSLTRFDGSTPWLLKDPFPPEVQVPPFSLEFDPATRQLWGFDYAICLTLCPPAHDPFLLDPLTGSWSFVHLPGLQLDSLLGVDTDIDPRTRELRYFGGLIGNSSYSLDRLENRADEPLNPPFHVVAVAHKPPIGGAQGVETYVVGRLPGQGLAPSGTPWYQLARIGGPGGDPPASSGEVTILGPVDIPAERLWFDIAADGTAYLAALLQGVPDGEANRLYRVDLASGALEEIGILTQPGGSAFLSGIAVAPPGLGESVVEIPALSGVGLGLFALALCTVAVRRSLRRRVAASI